MLSIRKHSIKFKHATDKESLVILFAINVMFVFV